MVKEQETTKPRQNSKFFISGDTIKIKINENSSPLSVTHVGDFGNYFPDVDLSPPSRQINGFDIVV